MPLVRRIGNVGLSFINKLSTGYWDLMDPTNGYTAIHAAALDRLPLDRIDRRFFFESDMLFRLATIRAVVRDVPMTSFYGSETSHLRPGRALAEFLAKHAVRKVKRFFYLYLLRDFSAGSAHTLSGLLLLLSGGGFGAVRWAGSVRSGVPATTGTVMLSVLPIILGVQLLLQAWAHDIAARPVRPLQVIFGDG